MKVNESLVMKWNCHCYTGDSVGGGLNQWQSTAKQEEQKELEETVVPPKRQGALHLQSPRGEGKYALPFNLNHTYFTPIQTAVARFNNKVLYVITCLVSSDLSSICRRR